MGSSQLSRRLYPKITMPPKKAVVPARPWHPAECEHKFCNCYNPAGHVGDDKSEEDKACQHCSRRMRNRRMAEEYRQSEERRKAGL